MRNSKQLSFLHYRVSPVHSRLLILVVFTPPPGLPPSVALPHLRAHHPLLSHYLLNCQIPSLLHLRTRNHQLPPSPPSPLLLRLRPAARRWLPEFSSGGRAGRGHCRHSNENAREGGNSGHLLRTSYHEPRLFPVNIDLSQSQLYESVVLFNTRFSHTIKRQSS